MTHEPAVPERVVIDGRTIPLTLRRNARARAISLRVDPRDRGLVLVMPTGVNPRLGLEFITARADWVRRRLAALPAPVCFADGARVPLLGVEHIIRHAPGTRRGAWAEDGILHVAGEADFIGRRVADFLKRRARDEIAPRARAFADRLDRRVARISIRDTRSRWGSCSCSGALSFSWRLVMAPEHVLDYVVAHEAAHLVELNHSPRFWAVVDSLGPDTHAAKAWLKTHGATLQRYG